MILIFFSGSMQIATAQISRGASDGEFYLSVGLFYNDNLTFHWGLFHSNDDGNHLSLQYSSTHDGFWAIGDPVSGNVYGYRKDTMWMSNDFGLTWNKYTASVLTNTVITVGGNSPGEFYLEDSLFNIYSSLDYGHTFTQVNDSGTFFQLADVGVQTGTLYAGDYFPQSYDPAIRTSHNYGHTFSIQPLDPGLCCLSRGAVNNEIYLAHIYYDTIKHFRICQSFDEGATFITRGVITPS